ncbi:MAG: hypothetical protein WC824_08230 [Bacteroidota bacterium]|jgi:hypothetical protein
MQNYRLWLVLKEINSNRDVVREKQFQRIVSLPALPSRKNGIMVRGIPEHVFTVSHLILAEGNPEIFVQILTEQYLDYEHEFDTVVEQYLAGGWLQVPDNNLHCG